MVAFRSPVDICNRGLQHIGSDTINETVGFLEVSSSARQCKIAYDKVRETELRRNTWRFATRRTAIRPIATDTMFLMPTLFQGTATYFVGSIVADETNNLWQSRVPNNLNNDPQNSLNWEQYFGPMTVHAYDSTTTYFAGELVYTQTGDGGARVYVSLQDGNADNPATATAWDATVTYRQNDVVTRLAVAYMSLTDLNTNHQPPNATYWATAFVGGTGSIKWRQIGGPEFPAGVGVVPISIIYPLGSGPYPALRNVYRLPAGYLREAAQDPKQGSHSPLGGPSGLIYNDWQYSSNYIVTRESSTILYRFVANVSDVTEMDPMFCEALAAAVGVAVAPKLTQSTTKKGIAEDEYQKAIVAARLVNGIEVGADEPAEDDLLTCRR